MIALTGTPGTGKTSVAEELRRRGHDVLDLKKHISDSGLRGEYVEEMDTYDVDTDLLRESLRNSEHEMAEGHLSHFLDTGMCIVMRCHPDVLAQRLRDRGYAEGRSARTSRRSCWTSYSARRWTPVSPSSPWTPPHPPHPWLPMPWKQL